MVSDSNTQYTGGLRSSVRSQFGSVPSEAPSRKASPHMHKGPVVIGGTRSQFGSQSESFKRTAPSIGFGSGPRFKQETLFISKEHSSQQVPGWTPGPGAYRSKSSIGPQPESTRVTRDQPGFSKDDRFGPDHREYRRRGVMPSPGDYHSDVSSIGPQLQSKTANATPIRFGTSTRDKKICSKGNEEEFYATESPGPKYPAGDGAVGHQTRGHRRTGASIGFTKDKRSIDPSKPNNKDRYTSSIPGPDQYMTREKIGRTKPAISFTRDTKEHAPYVSLSKEGADALLKGYLSPGPAYGALPSVGVQLETGKRNASIARFPKASRFPKSIREDTPGPGSYVT